MKKVKAKCEDCKHFTIDRSKAEYRARCKGELLADDVAVCLAFRRG